jgi:SAM-dependent methyltransferase
MTGVKAALKRHKSILIGYTILHSSQVRMQLAMGNFRSKTGATHASLTLEQSVAYIKRQFDEYLYYGQLKQEDLKDKEILEGGPGDNLGVALRMLAAGAKRMVCMDKFDSRHDAEQERRIYLRVRESLDPEQAKRFDEAVDLTKGIKFNPERIQAIYGRGMEMIGDTFDKNTFDMIVSRGVIQEIFDGDRVFSGMEKALRPGGIMLHKVDLRDYGLFSGNGHNPLTFLTIPRWVYKLMAQNSDRQGRRMVDYYRGQVQKYGYDWKIYVSSVIQRGYPVPVPEVMPHKEKLTLGVDYTEDTLAMVREIRPHLQKQFQHLSDEDLMTSAIFMVARKKA